MNRKIVVILLACAGLVLFPVVIKRYQARNIERSIDECPIIIINNSGDSIHFTCLNREECIPPIENLGTPNNPGIDEESNLYFPFYDHSDIFYIDLKQQSVKHITTDPNPKLENFLNIYSLYAYGKVVLADFETVVIISKDSSYKIVQPEEVGGISIGGLVRGKKDQVITFNPSPVEKDGKSFVKVFIIDLNSGDVVEKLLPCPPFVEVTQASLAEQKPGVRCGLTLVSVMADLDKLYYIFQESGEAGEVRLRLGVFDTKDERGLHVYGGPSGCVPPPGRYRQHNEYLFVEPGKGGPLLLRLKDLSPVADFEALQRRGLGFGIQALGPFGQYFLVGTPTEAFVLSQDGDVLREYSLPVELFGKSYTFVEYLND
ncbi:MAG: hypothetical protein SXV54_21765 [Chloroflexota bacterium]|nr:hypothetical protein [Chloroflexota bacterium]